MSDAATTTIYIVTSGSYSDYHIDAVFSSSELAQQYISKICPNCDSRDYNIEEYVLDVWKDAESFQVWQVGIFLDSGDIKDSRLLTYGIFDVKYRGQICESAVLSQDQRLVTWVRSSVSEEHALKLAVEARQEWLREKGGTE